MVSGLLVCVLVWSRRVHHPPCDSRLVNVVIDLSRSGQWLLLLWVSWLWIVEMSSELWNGCVDVLDV